MRLAQPGQTPRSGSRLAPESGSVYACAVTHAHRHLAGIAAAALLVLFLQPASADADAARRARDIASHTMSPFCPGRTLAACSSPDAATWRQDIRRWVDEGVATEEIRARLELRVPGENLSGAPPAVGGWILPPLVAGASALLLVVILRRLRRRAKQGNETPLDATQEQPDLNRRLEAELTRLND